MLFQRVLPRWTVVEMLDSLRALDHNQSIGILKVWRRLRKRGQSEKMKNGRTVWVAASSILLARPLVDY